MEGQAQGRAGRWPQLISQAYYFAAMNAPQTLSRWSQPGSSRVPFWAYTDAQLYQRELEKIFYGEHWCYVGLEVEIPNVGDYKLSWVGERQVIMVRDRVAPKDRGVDTGVRVVENRCAHRGVRFCQQPRQCAQLRVPLSPVDLQAQWRSGGVAVQGRRQGRRAASTAACPRTSTSSSTA